MVGEYVKHWRLRKLNIGFVPKSRETIYTNLCKLKQKVEFEDCKDVIYSVPCKKCGVRYIGETGQHFYQRREQHKGDIRNNKASNGFYSHLKKTKDILSIGKELCFWIERNIGGDER